MSILFLRILQCLSVGVSFTRCGKMNLAVPNSVICVCGECDPTWIFVLEPDEFLGNCHTHGAIFFIRTTLS